MTSSAYRISGNTPLYLILDCDQVSCTTSYERCGFVLEMMNSPIKLYYNCEFINQRINNICN